MTLSPALATDFSDLEIRIFARQEEGYGVEITVDGDQHFERGFLCPEVLDWQPGQSPGESCKWLTEKLFSDPRLASAWAEARGMCKARRVHLRISPDAPELHPLPWELLGERAGDGSFRPLSMDADTPFSRYLAGQWKHGRPIITRPLRVLLAVSDPHGLGDYGLDPIDTDAECQHFQTELKQSAPGSLEVEILEGPITLQALGSKLREGFHCLHLMAHGSFSEKRGEAVLMLEDGDGQVELVRDHQFAAMLDQLESCPSLVFLASCQSATGSLVEAWRGLAPALVKTGVPAVIAMRDIIDIRTARHFAGAFYQRLLSHGLVDLAVNEARASLLNADLPDPEVPALFMHLREGRLLLLRGKPIGIENGEHFWNVLLENIEEGDCTFFLGPGVNSGLLPSENDMAQALARDYSYPFPPPYSLTRVTQFAGILDGHQVRRKLMRRMARGLLHLTGLDTRNVDEKMAWDEAMAICNAEGCLPAPGIHSQLADFGLPVYLTTTFDGLMSLALEQKGREVRRRSLRWQRDRGFGQRDGREFDPSTTREQPMVMHLFGHFGSDLDLRSMVLTEDDHLDFLARISRDHEYILPPSLAASLAENALVFLGFSLRDPAFRILLRGLLNHLDLGRWGRSHIAVLSSELEGGVAVRDTVIEVTRKHLQSQNIDLFWGHSQQFVGELHERWKKRAHV